VPESQPHDIVVDLLKQILLAWAARVGDAQVARNLAVRWDESRPQMGVDPDLCVIRPPTPEGDELMSLCTWERGHSPPVLAVEVVSASNARKDYATAPERYAACGTAELWVFDPRLVGPRLGGGPHRLQIWSRTDDGDLTRTYAGTGPAWSKAVDGWVLAVDEGRKLRIASDPRGEAMWLTSAESERTEKERERAEKERERAEKEELQRRVAELESRLRR
jgi:Uma2 family endonuclease